MDLPPRVGDGTSFVKPDVFPLRRRHRYLNRADVQQALRVREGTVWEQCSSQVQYQTTDMLRPMMPYYQRLLKDYDIAVLVFSGVRATLRCGVLH